MKNILKRSAVWDIYSKLNPFDKATIILTGKYTLLIFVLLFIVNAAVFVFFMLQFGVPIGNGPLQGTFTDDSHMHEASEQLLTIMLSVNGVILVIASVFSYFLARVTLRPIRQMYHAQEKFLADVAHELRTPLSVIKIGAETVLRKDRTISEYTDFITDAHHETSHLIALTNRLLSMLAGSIQVTREIETVDFSQLVTRELDRICSYATEHDIVCTRNIQPDIFVRGVESELVRMVKNILKNAIDYNKPGGTVHVTVTQGQSSVHLVVADTGQGISKESLPHVFERFYKADSARTDSSGSGLGLSLVKEIVDVHQGSIDIQSTAGEGTRVTVIIPCV